MSDYRLYLSLIPQGLIASMLPPDQFGSYYALGSKVHASGEAIFFEVDPAQLPRDVFPLQLADERCVPNADGSPKKSVYIAIYRVLSQIPVAAGAPVSGVLSHRPGGCQLPATAGVLPHHYRSG